MSRSRRRLVCSASRTATVAPYNCRLFAGLYSSLCYFVCYVSVIVPWLVYRYYYYYYIKFFLYSSLCYFVIFICIIGTIKNNVQTGKQNYHRYKYRKVQ